MRFVTEDLFPYLRSLSGRPEARKVAEIFEGVTTVMKAGFYQDQPAELACTRYFGAEVDEAGPVRLVGRTRHGQRFMAHPSTMWVASASRASVVGAHFGEMGPAPKQAHLRDFAIPPARGVRHRARVLHRRGHLTLRGQRPE